MAPHRPGHAVLRVGALGAPLAAGTETENKIYARRSYGSNKKFLI